MRSNFKRLGNYIEAVNKRNSDCSVTDLRGLSLTKEFRSSTSNIVGTDMSTYKVMQKFDFAANFMGLGVLVDKAAIVLKKDETPNIVSGAYPVFRVKDENILHPEYLMMWLIRSEFDRYCVFKSDKGIRGGFDWNDLLETELPIPSITKQREIVKEYNTIQNRIALNQQLIQKLEETAQAIYDKLFIECADITWMKAEIKTFGNVVTGKTPSSENPEDFGNEMPFVTPGDFKNYKKHALGAERGLSKIGYSKLKNKILPSGSIIVTCIGSDMGKISISSCDCITNQQMNSIIVKESYYTDYLFYYLQSIADEIKGIALGGSTMPMLSKTDFEKIEVVRPDEDVLVNFQALMKPINVLNITYSKEIMVLKEIKELLLSRLATTEN